MSKAKRPRSAPISHSQILAQVMAAIPDTAFVKDKNGIYLAINPAGAAHMGKSVAEVIGHTDRQLFPRAISSNLIKTDRWVLTNGVALSFENTLCVNGVQRYFTATKLPCRGPDGKIIGIIGFVREVTISKLDEATVRQHNLDLSERAEHARILAKRLIETQELERRRVARELHDGVNQILSSAKFRVHSIANERDLRRIRARLRTVADMIDNAIHETIRISHNLLPAILHDLGLNAALRSLCNEFSERTGAQCHFKSIRSFKRIGPELTLALYRIIQESLNNIEKHSGASRVFLAIERKGASLVTLVRDNGAGFDVEALAGRNESAGFGLHSMRERAAYHGGVLKIHSTPGIGTTVEVIIDLSKH